MLKKIKTTKQMRLDELIKYVWDNGIENRRFCSIDEDDVKTINFGENGELGEDIELFVNKKDLYEVEIEKPITKDTVFKCLLEIIDGELVYIRNKKTIKESVKDDTDRFYALIDGKLQLVWEADSDELRE